MSADNSIFLNTKRFFAAAFAATLLVVTTNVPAAQARYHHYYRRHHHYYHYFNHQIERRLPDRFAYIVVEATTGYVLESFHADHRLYPASLSKLMTLYLTFDALDSGQLRLDDYVPVSRQAAAQVPSKIGVIAGGHIRVGDCIRAITTHSANDCAYVLSEAVGGTARHFAKMMTAEARRLGMRNTHFVNPTGLYNKEQYSSPRDMAILARALLRNHPNDYHYFSVQSFTYGGETFPNGDELLKTYPGMDGLKTGYVYASGYNLVSSAVHDGTRLIGVIFGGRTIRSRNREMVKILNNGFARVRHIRLTTLLNAQGAQKLVLPSQRPFDIPTGHEIKAGPQEDSNIPAPMPQIQPVAVTVAQQQMNPDGAGYDAAPRIASMNHAGNWMIQIGSFYSRHTSEQALQTAKSSLRGAVSGVDSIAPLMTVRGIVYRARLSGLDHRSAVRACRIIKGNCIVLSLE